MSHNNDIEVVSETEGTSSNSVYDNDRAGGNLGYALHDQNVSTQPLTGGGVVTRSYTKTPHYLPLAILVVFINPPFGLLAIMFSLLSQRSTRNDDVERARKRATVSVWMSIVGIALALVVAVFVLVYFFVIEPNIIRTIDGLSA